MSGPERAPDPAVPTTKLKRKHLCDEDHAELDHLDTIFKRIRKAIPHAPYILSTPSMYPYQYHSRQESQAWMMGHLFKPDEEHLQYRTFLFREPYQDCFTLQPGEDDEPEAPKPKSQAANASTQAPKKKISLSDYKSKQANGVIASGSKKVSPNLAPTRPTPAHTNGVKPPEKRPPAAAAHKQEESKPQKRPAPDSLKLEKPEKRAREDRSPPHSSIHRKTESLESKINLDKSGPSSSTPHGLPPLLSPVDEPLSNPYGLPAILSPTLPSSILAELDKLETQRKRAESNASTSSSDRKSQLLSVPESRTQTQEDGSKSASRERSVSLNGKSPVSLVDHTEESKPELVVKLKYTKKTRETIKQLLKLPPKRDGPAEKKEREETPKDRTVNVQKKGVGASASKSKPVPKMAARRPEPLNSIGTTSSKAPVVVARAAEKRPRSEDDSSQTAPSKRARAHSIQDGPNTPKDQIIPSPAFSNKSSAQKSQGAFTTPRKDLKSINMLRANSSEGFNSTPGRSSITPTGTKHLDVKAPTSTPTSGKKQMDIGLLQHTSQKLNQMGRALKHEGQKFEKERSGKLSKDDQKRAAVIGLECILSYMAAYHAQDLSLQLRGRPAEVEGTWKTLLPLCVSYVRLTKDFKHLDGFRSHLGSVIAANICTLLAPRAPSAKAHDSPHELSQAELAKQHAQLSENFGLLSKHYTMLMRHTQDARISLPMDDLQKLYQKTWAGAELNAKLADGPEKYNAAKLSGPYYLPIQNDTTPIQAVRFGLKFLSEYCEKERIDHTLRVNLDRPE